MNQDKLTIRYECNLHVIQCLLDFGCPIWMYELLLNLPYMAFGLLIHSYCVINFLFSDFLDEVEKLWKPTESWFLHELNVDLKAIRVFDSTLLTSWCLGMGFQLPQDNPIHFIWKRIFRLVSCNVQHYKLCRQGTTYHIFPFVRAKLTLPYVSFQC